MGAHHNRILVNYRSYLVAAHWSGIYGLISVTDHEVS